MADPRRDATGLVMRHFTLSPTKGDAYGTASREALRAYALSIIKTNPRLAGDLTAWAERSRPGVANPDERMTWGEFKTWVEDNVQVTDETPMGFVDVGTVAFLRRHAGEIEAEIDSRGELCIR